MFVEPVSKRRDGIQAMFARAGASTGEKRKREVLEMEGEWEHNDKKGVGSGLQDIKKADNVDEVLVKEELNDALNGGEGKGIELVKKEEHDVSTQWSYNLL